MLVVDSSRGSPLLSMGQTMLVEAHGRPWSEGDTRQQGESHRTWLALWLPSYLRSGMRTQWSLSPSFSLSLQMLPSKVLFSIGPFLQINVYTGAPWAQPWPWASATWHVFQETCANPSVTSTAPLGRVS